MDKAEGTNTFNEEDMYFLSAFANQAAVAITNAKLFDDVRREERLRTSASTLSFAQYLVDEMVHKNTGHLSLGGAKKKVPFFSAISGVSPP